MFILRWVSVEYIVDQVSTILIELCIIIHLLNLLKIIFEHLFERCLYFIKHLQMHLLVWSFEEFTGFVLVILSILLY